MEESHGGELLGFLLRLMETSLCLLRCWSSAVMGLLDVITNLCHHLVQFSSVAQSCLTLCNPMNCSTPGLPVHHQLPEFTQTHVD